MEKVIKTKIEQNRTTIKYYQKQSLYEMLTTTYFAIWRGKLVNKCRSQTFLMPDGHSHQTLGEIGASLVSVESKMCSLKMQWMGDEKRENWADMLIFQLKRLPVASSSEVVQIYKSILSIVSDAKVNKGLGAEISSKFVFAMGTWSIILLYSYRFRISIRYQGSVDAIPVGD